MISNGQVVRTGQARGQSQHRGIFDSCSTGEQLLVLGKSRLLLCRCDSAGVAGVRNCCQLLQDEMEHTQHLLSRSCAMSTSCLPVKLAAATQVNEEHRAVPIEFGSWVKHIMPSYHCALPGALSNEGL